MQATKVSADGEQTAADAERSRKAAEDLELYVRNTLLAAEGNDKWETSKKTHLIGPVKTPETEIKGLM